MTWISIYGPTHRLWLTLFVLALGCAIASTILSVGQWWQAEAASRRLLSAGMNNKEETLEEIEFRVRARLGRPIPLGKLYADYLADGRDRDLFDKLLPPGSKESADWNLVRYGVHLHFELPGLFWGLAGLLFVLRLWIPWLTFGKKLRPENL